MRCLAPGCRTCCLRCVSENFCDIDKQLLVELGLGEFFARILPHGLEEFDCSGQG